MTPYPVWTYDCDGYEVQKSLCMIHGENTVVAQYRAHGEGRGDVYLEVRPLVAFRDYHALTGENEEFDGAAEVRTGQISIQPYPGLPQLHFVHNAIEVDQTSYWHYRFEYERERERGLDCVEDLYTPFMLRFDLGRKAAHIVVSTEAKDASEADELMAQERSRRKRLAAGDRFESALRFAADQFIVRRGDGKSIIAGYPWFADWSRDTMIALPGLTLETGRFDVARSILLNFGTYVDQGMLPNRFPDKGAEPEYNTVDGTLWFFVALQKYLGATKDVETGEALFPALVEIVDWHLRGTRYGIGVDHDGLLAAGQEGQQLTWMDAKVGDWVVTPRRGKAVEIQALWYNALKFMEELAATRGYEAGRYRALAEKAKRAFRATFWNEDAGCFFDVVDGDEKDASIRPNQLIALSLPHVMVTRAQALSVLDVVDRELLTPVGVRTLSPCDPPYCLRYEGDTFARDAAYHQGTVWPWLIGPYFDAVKRFRGAAAAKTQASSWLASFEPVLKGLCLGQVPEIFDAEPPHAPRGCPAQAWSVAEVLRVCKLR
jgi:predicted glycogen debranching enzyme